MRNERLGLAAPLMAWAGMAHAQVGAWFPPSPCASTTVAVVAPLGGHAFLSVHGQPSAPPRDVVLHRGMDGDWRVPLELWSTLSPLPPPVVETLAGGVREVPLKPGPRLAARLDACTSELWVDADPTRSQTVHINPQQVGTTPTPAGWGGFLNLDAEYGGFQGSGQGSGLFDLGAFAPAGALRSGLFLNNHGGRRLDTDLIHDQPGEALRLQLGDAISRAADWESAVRYGGVQWGTNFSLQPDRITFPLPSVSGSAAVASTAQLYVNGQRLSQQALQPGQFQLDSVPVLTGAGELAVVVRDALGRLQTVTQPFYASPRLLAAGLDSWTVESGFLRENYAQPGDRYAQPFAAGTFQRGLLANLTGLLRAAAGGQRQQLGTEADWVPGRFGVLTLSGAGSHTEAGWGGVATLGFDRVADPFSFSLRRRFATSAYGDLGRAPGTLHFSDNAHVSYNGGRFGVASLVYDSEQPWDAVGARLLGLAYTLQPLRDVQAYLSWLHPLNGVGGDSLVIGVSINLWRGTSGGLQWNRANGASGERAFIQHSPQGPLGWSYYASADASQGGVRQAQTAWASERGTLGAGYVEFGGHGTPSASALTGVALLDGHAFWTRPVQNSFAVVDAGPVAGVRVYRENQLVGVTGDGGRLLVPDLQPFQTNHLSIDDRDLPITLGLVSGAGVIAPPANAGVPVHFAVDRHPSVRLRLLDAKGKSVPAGAIITIDGKALLLPVGYDGLVYADISEGRHRLEARWVSSACSARLTVSGPAAVVSRCEAQP